MTDTANIHFEDGRLTDGNGKLCKAAESLRSALWNSRDSDPYEVKAVQKGDVVAVTLTSEGDGAVIGFTYSVGVKLKLIAIMLQFHTVYATLSKVLDSLKPV